MNTKRVMLICFTSVLLLVKAAPPENNQLVSPCPDIFQYEKNQTEPDRWYGTAIVTAEQDLAGVWFRVILDAESIQLGNWFGEVETRDNKLGYLIKSPNYKLVAGKPLKIRFYVKYDPSKPVPKLQSFRLNAVIKCPEGGQVTEVPVTTGQLFTNKPDVVRPNTQQGLLDPNTCGTIEQSGNEFPWYAALYSTNNVDLGYLCGATLISLQHVVTSASCVTKQQSQEALESDKLVVYLGKYLVRDWQSTELQTRKVDKIIVYSKYSPKKSEHDIAILKLSEPLELTSTVRPLCLPEKADLPNNLDEQTGTVAGYDEFGRSLIDNPLTVLPQNSCEKEFPENSAGFKERSTFCGGFKNGTCNRNSGSAFVLPNPGSAQREIKGIVSTSNQSKCDSSLKVILTDIQYYLDFIYTAIKL